MCFLDLNVIRYRIIIASNNCVVIYHSDGYGRYKFWLSPRLLFPHEQNSDLYPAIGILSYTNNSVTLTFGASNKSPDCARSSVRYRSEYCTYISWTCVAFREVLRKGRVRFFASVRYHLFSRRYIILSRVRDVTDHKGDPTANPLAGPRSGRS